METVLETRKLKKIYNYHTDHPFEALHEIDFKAYKGEFVSIMGPSGSGKSTFINNISTIDFPSSGNVYINGIEIRTMSSNEIGRFRYEHLGFIFQDFNLLDTHTMYENIAMPLALKHENKETIKAIIHDLAQKMQIEHLLSKYPYECSGGQRQRGAICRALVNHPDIIVADEPTGNLDSANSSELMSILSELNNQGVTIIMVTHDALIASYSSRLIYIKDGRIETELKRESLSQEEYFDQIVQLNAQESRGIISD